ncbi:hypothetical protein VMCG_04673 [Cytospora schulzeri]|uniref:Uncharacterized protein n=1 Tax=Cytospora schulzeri TaxID=448051 RepID=A0A423WSP3_9PEZI|nr:hypothetical protein VMCG_04673 [Valsa malicola]
MSTATPLSLSKVSRNSAGALLTPNKPVPSQLTESPGNWQHPRMEEITYRQNATVFTAQNAKTIVYNLAAILIIHLMRLANAEFGPPQLQALPLLNIGTACLPLVRSKDDLSDIPLTSAQRQLLGLSPSTAPTTADSAYSTPPRYSRTPSMTGSVGKPSPASSPVSTNDSSGFAPRFNGSLYSPAASPLLQKALRTSSYGSQNPFNISAYGIQSPLDASTSSFNLSTGSSVFSEPPPTPSPIGGGGKRISVGLNNKWLYDRSRRTSGW